MTAGRSDTPLPRKLGIKVGTRLALLGAGEGFDDLLGELPPEVRVRGDLRGGVDVVLFFTRSRQRLEGRIEALRRAIHPAGALWVAWPKRASGVPSDMTEDVVREVALPLGLVDNKVAALDETWSGLRLVVRLERREEPR